MSSDKCQACGHPIDDPSAPACSNCGAALSAPDSAPGTSAPASSPPRAAAPPPPLPPGGSGGGPASPPGDGGSSVPFDDVTLPFLQRFIETVKLAFTDPVRLFSNLPADDIWPPLIFGVCTGTVAMVIGSLWQILFGGVASLAEGAGAEGFVISTGFIILMMIFSPVLVAAGLFIAAGIYHLMLMLVGGASRPFGVTMRAVCYGYTPNLISVVPICGGIIGGLWSLVLVIIGAKVGHDTDWWRAILAYFLPMLVCCCLIFGLASMFGVIGSFAD